MKQNDIKRIGIVGSGIAGLSAAWLLKNRYQVDLYEQNDYVGGHTHTIEVLEGSGMIPIDTGFIVYNEPNYPLLTALLDYLDVETQNTD
ncbi:MAG: NAD(P)-binding protein, partial [Candidatus Thiodiazotropha lotti]|nr:NAD(P)-binding protein [Candidatus Thiodiazotropha lotti]MCW4222634.1 NAD(P)-binding protein [Candidatus Thiodiazotropha lotti]